MKKRARTFVAVFLAALLIKLTEVLTGTELTDKFDRGLYYMVAWLSMNELLKDSDN